MFWKACILLQIHFENLERFISWEFVFLISIRHLTVPSSTKPHVSFTVPNFWTCGIPKVTTKAKLCMQIFNLV